MTRDMDGNRHVLSRFAMMDRAGHSLFLAVAVFLTAGCPRTRAVAVDGSITEATAGDEDRDTLADGSRDSGDDTLADPDIWPDGRAKIVTGYIKTLGETIAKPLIAVDRAGVAHVVQTPPVIGTHLWELRRDGSVRKSGELGCPGIRFASTSLTLDTQDTAIVAAVVNTAAIDHCMIGGVRHDLQITDRVIVAADATLSPRWIARVKGQVSKPWGSKIVVASSGTGDVFVAGAGERSGVTIGPKVIMPATSGRDPRLWIAGLSGATGEFLWAQTGHGKNAAGTPLGSFTAALVGHAGHGWLLSYYSKKIILAGTELVAPSPSCGDFLPLHGAIASFDAKLGSLSLLRPSADTPDSGCRPATTALAATPEGPCVAGAIRAAHVVGGVSIPMAGTNTAENPHELFAACFDATAQKARWTFHLGTTIPEKSVALRTGQNGRLYLSAEIDQPIHVAGQTLWAPTGQPSFLLIVFDASSGTIVDALVIPGLPAAQTAFDVDRDGAITLATRLLQPTTLGGRRIVPHVRGTLVIWRITSGH